MANEKRLIDGNGRYTLHASDNTDYSLLFRNGIICVENELGHCVCEFYAEDAPAVDAEEVVRCKECKSCTLCYPEKQLDKEATPAWLCEKYKRWRNPDFFCADGERREGE